MSLAVLYLLLTPHISSLVGLTGQAGIRINRGGLLHGGGPARGEVGGVKASIHLFLVGLRHLL